MRSRRVTVAVVTATLTAGLGALGAGGAANATSCWSMDTSAVTLGTASSLIGVSSLSACSAWAAGWYDNGGGVRPLAEHWNGTSWSAEALPVPSDTVGGISLSGVTATSNSGVWAVGYYGNGTADRTLVEHYDGANWSATTARNPFGAAQDHGFVAVSASGPKDVWAVGWAYKVDTSVVPLIEHWDGTDWTVNKAPLPAGVSTTNPDTELEGVTALSASNAWAVGYYDGNTTRRTYALHWNGAHWKLQPTLALAKGTSYYELDSVDATSGSNVFAAGHYRRGTSTYPLVMHWNGTKWSKQAAPQPGSSAEFTGVTTLGPNAAWAVGEHGGKTLIEHWNGSKWTVERTPSPGTYNGLWGVDAVSSASLWAVGGYNDGAVHPLSLRPS